MLEKCEDDIDIQEVKDKYDNVAQAIDVMNCLYDDSVEDDINDLSHLSINRFESEEE